MDLLGTKPVIYFFKGQGHVADHLFAVPPAEVAFPSL